MKDVLQWLAIVIEFAGLTLVAIELYAPRSSQRLVEALAAPDPDTEASLRRDWRGVGSITVVYVIAWILGAIAVSVWDPALNLTFNLWMTIFTVAFSVVVVAIGKLMRLGVVLGRGNSVGGIGLVLALIGFSLEIAQLV